MSGGGGAYPVRVAGGQEKVEIVTGVDAVSSISDELLNKVAEVDIITMAVGPVVLEHIAPAIAKGLIRRSDNGNSCPLNIIACENMVRGTCQLKGHVMNALPENTMPGLRPM